MELHYTTVETPIGELVLATRDGVALARVVLPAADGSARPDAAWRLDRATLPVAAARLAAYATGAPDPLDLPLDRSGSAGTPFQEAVWAAIEAIPYGETRTYAEIAAAIGRPRATRAVGSACGANPLPVVRPCHRVVAAAGLGGFAGGLAQKRALLALEAAAAA